MNSRHFRGLLFAFSMFALVLCGTGCIFSPDDTGDDDVDDTPSYIFPSLPDSLMANFIIAYTDREFAPFDDAIFGDGILHDDYRFYQDFGSAMGDWTYADELIFLEHLFMGTLFTNAQGKEVEPVNSITLTLDGSAGGWVESDDLRFPSDPDEPDCWKRTYSVVFDVGQPDMTLQVRNDNTFFVKRREVTHNDEPLWYYQICGQVELETAK